MARYHGKLLPVVMAAVCGAVSVFVQVQYMPRRNGRAGAENERGNSNDAEKVAVRSRERPRTVQRGRSEHRGYRDRDDVCVFYFWHRPRKPADLVCV